MQTKDRKLTYDTDWQKKYSDAVTTADEALSMIQPGQRVFIGTGCGEPQELVESLAKKGPNLSDIEVIHLLTFGKAPYASRELSKYFTVNSFFISDNVRDIIQEGLGDYTPIFLSDIPNLFHSGRIPLDAALIQVSPPDEKGMCSLGVSVDIVKSAAQNASLVIAEVNPRMPRTLGDSLIHVYDIDALVPTENEILTFEQQKSSETTRRIGEYIAALVDDGSTVELGIGRIPHSVIEFLKHKKDLGIHTEMFTDSMLDLVESGAVTGKMKTVNKGKVVASFCLGTRKLYNYIDGNEAFSFHPTEYVNDPFLISRQHKMVAINVALEVDLTGQVCADSIGTRFFSGIGGQVDFNRGAARSPGGKAIIAMPSTAKDGTVSRIKCNLSTGAGVVTTRGDVHYVVTEYGVAYLHGKSVQERALALISIAHPDFRAELLKKAIEAKFVREGYSEVEGKILTGPPELNSSYLLDDGTKITFRPIHPTDEPRMKDLFYALSQETLYYRFMTKTKRVPRKQVQDFTYIDHRNEVAIVGTLPESYGDEIIAIGRYYLNKKTNRAEVAFVVRDKWQNRGIGSALYRHLGNIARRNGITGFTAEVLRENKAMQAVFYKSGHKVKTSLEDGVYSFVMDFE